MNCEIGIQVFIIEWVFFLSVIFFEPFFFFNHSPFFLFPMFLQVNVHRIDPDILIGHNFTGFDLDVLLHQMREHKVDHWSRLGRLKRSM